MSQFTLTKENYFSPERPQISSSGIKDYLLSPKLYKDRHILRLPEAQKKVSPAMVKGTIVDEILTEGKTTFSMAVLKRDDPELFEKQKLCPDKIATPAVWEEAQLIATQLPKHPVWSEGLAVAEFQKIVDDGRLCGKLDRFQPDKNFIIDLKITTEAAAKDARSWKNHCLKLGYHIQAGVYCYLMKSNPAFAHICAYTKDGVVVVKVYILPQEMIKQGMYLANLAVAGIEAGNFDEPLTTWEQAQPLEWTETAEVEHEDEQEDDF
jgi:hypothetical protein